MQNMLLHNRSNQFTSMLWALKLIPRLKSCKSIYIPLKADDLEAIGANK